MDKKYRTPLRSGTTGLSSKNYRVSSREVSSKDLLLRYTTTDNDSWFKTREIQHGDLKKQMEQLQKDIVNMKKEKMTLFVSTTAFRRNLLDLLGS